MKLRVPNVANAALSVALALSVNSEANSSLGYDKAKPPEGVYVFDDSIYLEPYGKDCTAELRVGPDNTIRQIGLVSWTSYMNEEHINGDAMNDGSFMHGDTDLTRVDLEMYNDLPREREQILAMVALAACSSFDHHVKTAGMSEQQGQ